MLELPDPFLSLPTHIKEGKGQQRQTNGDIASKLILLYLNQDISDVRQITSRLTNIIDSTSRAGIPFFAQIF